MSDKPKKPRAMPSRGEGRVIEVIYADGSSEHFHPVEAEDKVAFAFDRKAKPPILSIIGSSAGSGVFINLLEVRRFATH